jgi:hypothetical protein
MIARPNRLEIQIRGSKARLETTGMKLSSRRFYVKSRGNVAGEHSCGIIRGTT